MMRFPLSTLASSSSTLLFSSHLGVLVGEIFMGIASDVTRRLSLTATSLILHLLQSFCLLLHDAPLGVGVFGGYIGGDWAPQLCTLMGCSLL